MQIEPPRAGEGRATGRKLASSLNIAAFNLGNALSAWVGGLTIDQGPGLAALPLSAAAMSGAGRAIALVSLRMDRVRRFSAKPA